MCVQNRVNVAKLVQPSAPTTPTTTAPRPKSRIASPVPRFESGEHSRTVDEEYDILWREMGQLKVFRKVINFTSGVWSGAYNFLKMWIANLLVVIYSNKNTFLRQF